MTRTCTICHTEKSLDDFYRHSNGTSYLTTCKVCHNARTMQYERRRKAADPMAYRDARRAVGQRYRARHRAALGQENVQDGLE